MHLIKKIFSIALSFILLSLTPFTVTATETTTAKPLTVYTSILPQRYFVEKIGGDRVKVGVVVSPGQSPATYEPTPQQIMSMGSADVFFTIGVPFEKAFLPKLKNTLPALNIVDTTTGIQFRTFNNTEIRDPHVWLSPKQVKIQAKNIYQALIEIDNAGKDIYQSGYNALIKELDNVDQELAKSLTPHKGKTMFVFHPAFGYFADDYGLKQAAIETGGKEPTPAKLQEIVTKAKKDNVSIVFVQPEFSQNSAKAIADAISGTVISLSPLNPDYINNLNHIAQALEKSFR